MPTKDRARKFGRRLDAALAALPNDLERRRFCDRQLETWERLYAAFIVDPGEPKPDGPCAADFLETICEISLRQIKYGGAMLQMVA